jgi:hypothetical protein
MEPGRAATSQLWEVAGSKYHAFGWKVFVGVGDLIHKFIEQKKIMLNSKSC